MNMCILPFRSGFKTNNASTETREKNLARYKLHSLALKAVTKNKRGKEFEHMVKTGRKSLFLGTLLPQNIIDKMQTITNEQDSVFDDIRNNKDKDIIFYKLIAEILNDNIPSDEIEKYNNILHYNIDKYVAQSSLLHSKCIKKLNLDINKESHILALEIYTELSANEEFKKSFCQDILKPIVKNRKRHIKNILSTSPCPELDSQLASLGLSEVLKDKILTIFDEGQDDLSYGHVKNSNPSLLHPLLKILSGLKHLKDLSLFDQTNMEALAEISSLKHLKKLTLENTDIPITIGGLENLQKLDITHKTLNSLPEEIGALKKITEFRVEARNLTTFPESIGECESLEKISILYTKLESLPDTIKKLKKLKILKIDYNPNLKNLPDIISVLTSLTELSLQDNKLQTLPNTIGNLTSLRDMDLRYNPNLTHLPESLSQLTNLRNLYLQGTGIEYDTLPEDIRNNPNLHIDIRPARVDIRGGQSVHAQPIEENTKKIITFLRGKYPDGFSLEEQNLTLFSIKQTLQNALKKHQNMPDFISAEGAVEKKPHTTAMSDIHTTEMQNMRFFYQKNNFGKDILVKIIELKNDKDITYLSPNKKWKISAAIRECDVMLSQELAEEIYKPKEIFALVIKFLEDVTKNGILDENMIENVIDTLYDNRRTYNLASIDNEAPPDDQHQTDQVSCVPGCINRIAMMAGLYIKHIKPSLPSPKDYNEQYTFILQRTLKDIFHNDALPPEGIEPELWQTIKDDVREQEAITPALWKIIRNDIRGKLHQKYEYCELNHENDLALWKPMEDNYQYFSIVDSVGTKGKKPVQEQIFVPNMSSE